MTEPDEMLKVRYLVDELDAATELSTKHPGFEVCTTAARLSARGSGPTKNQGVA